MRARIRARILVAALALMLGATMAPAHAEGVRLPAMPQVGTDGVYAEHNAPDSISPRTK